MIYTVTFNPSLDYIVSVPDFAMGVTNRTKSEMIVPGGKGLNVSMVLQNLGVETTSLGFEGGFTGKEIERRLKNLGVEADFIHVKNGSSRINVKIQNVEGTEINGIGPHVSNQELDELMNRMCELKDGDTLVLAGSIPNSISEDIYRNIMMKLKDRKIDIVVDATKKLLLPVLGERPFLIKPNRDELADMFETKIESREDIIQYAKELQKKGARNVLVSMAGDGAMLFAENGERYESAALRGTLVNGVGAGDSMIAGFLAGWLRTHDYQYAFRMGVAAGSASAFSDRLATADEVKKLMTQFP